jgi:hypothetical protein
MTTHVITNALVAAAAFTVLLAGAPLTHAACSMSQGDFDGNGTMDLRVRGDAARQVLELSDRGASVSVRLSCNGDADFEDATDIDQTIPGAFETFDVQLGGRDDIVIVFTKDAVDATVIKNLLLTLGPGGNTAELDLLSRLFHSSVTAEVQGGAGADVLRIFPAFSGAAVIVRGDLGAGDDMLDVLDPEISTGGAFLLNVDLGPGRNLATVPLPGLSSSFASIDLEGGDVLTGTDTVSVTVPQDFLRQRARFFFAAALRRGDDVFSVDLGSKDPFVIDATSEAHFSAAGGEGDDAVGGALLSGSAHAGVFELGLSGGPGSDVVTLDWSDLQGSGTDVVRLDGGDGNDTVIASVESTTTTALLDLLVAGGRGADTVYQALLAAPNLRFPVGGSTILDGGRDTPDTCLTFGSERISRIDCEPLF